MTKPDKEDRGIYLEWTDQWGFSHRIYVPERTRTWDAQ